PAGYDGALERSVAQYGSGVAPDTLVVMAAAVDPALRARGLAGALLTALREKAIAAGLSRVVVPVRPT
ncbi:GNAT family N-acetyltransferase, partial [Streptomyces sp. SID11233]|nr:GNAT family N-acetyltransferase [Streptomyces sp. SID11233]